MLSRLDAFNQQFNPNWSEFRPRVTVSANSDWSTSEIERSALENMKSTVNFNVGEGGEVRSTPEVEPSTPEKVQLTVNFNGEARDDGASSLVDAKIVNFKVNDSSGGSAQSVATLDYILPMIPIDTFKSEIEGGDGSGSYEAASQQQQWKDGARMERTTGKNSTTMIGDQSESPAVSQGEKDRHVRCNMRSGSNKSTNSGPKIRYLTQESMRKLFTHGHGPKNQNLAQAQISEGYQWTWANFFWLEVYDPPDDQQIPRLTLKGKCKCRISFPCGHLVHTCSGSNCLMTRLMETGCHSLHLRSSAISKRGIIVT